MNIGIIAEYNPFHNGHLSHINRTRQFVRQNNVNFIAVMSGDFVQRGEPASVDKFTRAEMALRNGVDLVIELPIVYATASAEFFAFGAVRLLDSLNIVDALSFGTETGRLSDLSRIAAILSDESAEFKTALKRELQSGGSFPVAREKSLTGIYQGDLDFLSHPNNILAIEYLKALNLLGSKMQPITVKREGAAYNSINLHGDICSASAIRHALSNGLNDSIKPFIPSNAYELFAVQIAEHGIASLNNYSDIFQYLLKTMQPSELAEILDVGEGLENRILQCGERFYELNDILTAVKTKRYTLARLRRAVLHTILGIRQSDANEIYTASDAGYIRVLGFNRNKSHLLRQIKLKASIPVVTKVRKEIGCLPPISHNMLKTELRASDLYSLSRSKKKAERNSNDFYTNICICGDSNDSRPLT